MTMRPNVGESEQAVARFLAQFPTPNRAEAIHLALQALRARVEPDRVLACELAWEVHCHGYWSQVRRAVLGAMPDIEAMELVERFFEVGAQVVESPNPVGIFLAGCRECLPEWELQATGRRRAYRHPGESDTDHRPTEFCPRGQNRE